MRLMKLEAAGLFGSFVVVSAPLVVTTRDAVNAQANMVFITPPHRRLFNTDGSIIQGMQLQFLEAAKFSVVFGQNGRAVGVNADSNHTLESMVN